MGSAVLSPWNRAAQGFLSKMFGGWEVGFKGGALKRLTRNLVETRFSKWSGMGSLSVIGFVKLQGASENLATSMDEG